LSRMVRLKVLAKTANKTPANATHWTRASMAAEMGISPSSVGRIWAEAGLKPHLVRRFKISNDPQFEEKVTDVVGLYMNPPDRALVLCVDEKSQIQALDRTQPGLPLKKGRAAAMTHDYKRNGTTTLFAALDVKTGLVIGECHPRHRAKEFIGFLKRIDRCMQRHLDIRLVLDNYGTHKTREVTVARQASPVPSALHADERLLAQSRRALLRRDHAKAHPPRHVQERGRTRGRYPRTISTATMPTLSPSCGPRAPRLFATKSDALSMSLRLSRPGTNR
jgi:DDE superfamily endonuclease